MADKCTNIMAVVVGRKMALLLNASWKLWLQNAETESIHVYTDVVKHLKDDNLQVDISVGMGFDGAATFSVRSLAFK